MKRWGLAEVRRDKARPGLGFWGGWRECRPWTPWLRKAKRGQVQRKARVAVTCAAERGR